MTIEFIGVFAWRFRANVNGVRSGVHGNIAKVELSDDLNPAITVFLELLLSSIKEGCPNLQHLLRSGQPERFFGSGSLSALQILQKEAFDIVRLKSSHP
jgi:hypothetical protein